MKEIIRLAEQFRKVAELGYLEKDLMKIGVSYVESLDIIHIGNVTRYFLKHSELQMPDEYWNSEECRNNFIEEYTLKLNEVKSIVNELRGQRIEEKIKELQQELQQVA